MKKTMLLSIAVLLAFLFYSCGLDVKGKVESNESVKGKPDITSSRTSGDIHIQGELFRLNPDISDRYGNIVERYDDDTWQPVGYGKGKRISSDENGHVWTFNGDGQVWEYTSSWESRGCPISDNMKIVDIGAGAAKRGTNWRGAYIMVLDNSKYKIYAWTGGSSWTQVFEFPNASGKEPRIDVVDCGSGNYNPIFTTPCGEVRILKSANSTTRLGIVGAIDVACLSSMVFILSDKWNSDVDVRKNYCWGNANSWEYHAPPLPYANPDAGSVKYTAQNLQVGEFWDFGVRVWASEVNIPNGSWLYYHDPTTNDGWEHVDSAWDIAKQVY